MNKTPWVRSMLGFLAVAVAVGVRGATLTYDGDQGLGMSSDGNMARTNTMGGAGAWVFGNDGVHPQGAAGKTLWIGSVTESLTSNAYWGPVASTSSIALSLQAGAYVAGEYMTYSAGSSDLRNGIARWTGTTTIYIFNGYGFSAYSMATRLTMRAVDYASRVPVPLMTAAAAGLDPNTGAVVPLTSAGATYEVNLLFEVDTTGGGNWQPAYQYFNNAQTQGIVGGAKYTFNSQFHYSSLGTLTIVYQPVALSVTKGSPASFNVLAQGTGTLSYQWKKNGSTIANATNSMFVINPASFSDAGSYNVVVSDDHDTLASSPANLNVTSPWGGAVDAGVSVSVNGMIRSLVRQADGKLVIGGDFTTVNGVARAHVARLLADGTLDTGFDPGSGPGYYVNSVAVQSDGKVVIGGSFGSVSGQTRYGIARLNADGSLDTGFGYSGSGVAGYSVYSLAIQADGKILMGGYFVTVNGTSRQRIARLNTDGSLDTGFNPGTGFNSDVYALTLQPDGKVLVGGYFTTYNGTARSGIARVNSDGSLDTGFNPGSGLAGNYTKSIVNQADGKILLGGSFSTYNGTGRSMIARVLSDGTLDTSFNPGSGANSTVETKIGRAHV